MFFKFLRFDILNGILAQYKKFILEFLMFVAMGVMYSVEYLNALNTQEVVRAEGATVGDYLLFFIAGIPVYDPKDQEQFMFPVLWLLVILTAAFFCLYYPYENLKQSGRTMLYLSNSRSVWWFSKCTWVTCSVAVFFIIAYFATALTAVISGARLTLETTTYSPYLIGFGVRSLKDGPWNILPLLFALPFITLAACLLQLTLSMVFKPIFSYIAASMLLLASSYFSTPLLIGNYAMAARSSYFMEGGFELPVGIILAAVLITASVLVGWGVFKRKDVF